MSKFQQWLRSFTLIELLVVIGIIGLLMGMLLPALARAREEARRTDCKNNLKNIGSAMFMYRDSYGEFFPAYDSDSSTDGYEGNRPTDGMSLLYPTYIETTQTFRCKSTRDNPKIYNQKTVSAGGVIEYTQIGFGASSPNHSSYGYDGLIAFDDSIERPIAADMDGTSVTDPRSATANHDGGQNVLYLGGHVKWTNLNTWDNNDVADNIFTNDLGNTDTDAYIRRP